ncbi:hypothetical protein [Wolbachia endosymbiont of Muscidifurax uniraptor]
MQQSPLGPRNFIKLVSIKIAVLVKIQCFNDYGKAGSQCLGTGMTRKRLLG